MTDPNNNQEARKRQKMRKMADNMENLELLKWASDDWVKGNDLDKVERDELAAEYRRRVNNSTDTYDMRDN